MSDDQQSSDPLVPGRVTKSYTIQYGILDLVTTLVTTKGPISPKHLRDLLTDLVTILRNPSALEILINLIEFKAATARVLRLNTNLGKRSIYRALEFLEAEGLVVKARPLSTRGRPTTVYALLDYTQEDLIKAADNDRLLRTPGYAEIQRITQLILDDYFPLLRSRGYEELYTAEVMAFIKRTQRGFRSRDLYHSIIENLSDRGVSVVSCPTIRIP